MSLQTYKTFQTLAETEPPVKWKFKNAVEANMEVARLETQLGLPRSPKSFDLRGLNSKITELQSLVAAKNAAIPTPTRTTATPTPASKAITLAEWKNKSDGDQRSFCRDGGQMKREDFLAMPSKAQSFFLAQGGHIEVETEANIPQTKNPSSNSMWIKDFLEKLTPAEQSAHFAAGKKVHN